MLSNGSRFSIGNFSNFVWRTAKDIVLFFQKLQPPAVLLVERAHICAVRQGFRVFAVDDSVEQVAARRACRQLREVFEQVLKIVPTRLPEPLAEIIVVEL